MSIKEFITKNNHKILTGAGIFGMFSMAALCVYATPKAMERIKNKKEELNKDKLSVLEIIKCTSTLYIVPVSVGILSTSCLVSSVYISEKRHMAVATAYTISSTAFAKHREKTKELIGEKKYEEVQEAVDKEILDKNYKSDIFIYNDKNMLCMDSVTGKIFESDISTIKEARNTINARMIDDMYVSLNDLYYELNIMPIPLGDDLGWHIEDGMIEFIYTSVLTDDNRPCLVITYSLAPKVNYSRCI